ncbi:MAG: FHIPEP family type III secretion protein [Rubripirellula sp.]
MNGLEFKVNYQFRLERYRNRRVSIDLMGRCTLWGTLSSIGDDHLILRDTIVQGDLEGHSWFDQMQYASHEDGGGIRNVETIVHMGSVMHVTYVDEAPLDELKQVTETAEEPSLHAETGSSELVESLQRLSQGLQQHSSEDDSRIEVPRESIEIQIGANLISFANAKRGGDLVDRVSAARRQIAEETGVVLPKIRIRDNLHLDPSEYQIMVNGHRVASASLMTNRFLAMNLDDAAKSLEGVRVSEPVFGLDAMWIAADQREQAIALGATVCDSSAVFQTHFQHALANHLHEVFSVESLADSLADFGESARETINAILGQRVSIALLHRLLKLLLVESVSIKNLMRIIESVGYQAELTSDHGELLQKLRIDIGRDICGPLLNDCGELQAILLDAETEQILVDTLPASVCDSAKQLVTRLQSLAQSRDGIWVVVVETASARAKIAERLAKNSVSFHVICRQEIPNDVSVVQIDDLDAIENPTSQPLPR